ncbi:FeoB-associated Cys-rich membrane protein [uncultured Cytophaga sp.]|uniref:FeoB-associated Cys-rich membrane protein n=1 Tax=uncultured Cytophaga sp. TaxID=160238 RepID=UPI002636F7BC|nr:FeoB-associated Cys-rich membrane protein [uncultured Cytophaga sp.]
MSENIQNIIIATIVGWALIYIVRRLFKQTSSKSEGCGGCSSNEAQQKLNK